MNVRMMLLTTVSKYVTTVRDPIPVDVTLLDMSCIIMVSHVKVRMSDLSECNSILYYYRDALD